ncbi:putative protein kinase [Trypanosoma cruzi]|uniref:Protein kinase domain-containing protein n=1 Tax=Trypanosoma cruzi TaxID=5693 RepID=A0A2V2VI96_TRYCR|nr:putative protein kinase [Trypanosoma cruzi]
MYLSLFGCVCGGTWPLNRMYDYSTLVTILSCTAVFKQGCHPRYNSGPVALKVTAAPPLPLASRRRGEGEEEGLRVDHEGDRERATASLCDGTVHPTIHEARVYALVCPHPSIPVFVECIEDAFDTSCFLTKEHHRGVRRLPVLVTQFVKAASLDRFFYSFPVLRWSIAVQVAHQVANVLQHVHSKGVVYGDLKLPNVLLGSEGHVWLVDFASAVILHSGVAVSEKRRAVEVEELARGITFHLRAPELFSTTQTPGTEAVLKHPFMVDFWAFGAFLLELLTGRPCLGAFAERSGKYTREELQAKAMEGCSLAKQRYGGAKGPHNADRVWDALGDLLAGLIQRSPEQRLGFRGGWGDVLQHRFFDLVGPDLLEPFPEEYAEENDELMLGL